MLIRRLIFVVLILCSVLVFNGRFSQGIIVLTMQLFNLYNVSHDECKREYLQLTPNAIMSLFTSARDVLSESYPAVYREDFRISITCMKREAQKAVRKPVTLLSILLMKYLAYKRSIELLDGYIHLANGKFGQAQECAALVYHLAVFAQAIPHSFIINEMLNFVFSNNQAVRDVLKEVKTHFTEFDDILDSSITSKYNNTRRAFPDQITPLNDAQDLPHLNYLDSYFSTLLYYGNTGTLTGSFKNAIDRKLWELAGELLEVTTPKIDGLRDLYMTWKSYYVISENYRHREVEILRDIEMEVAVIYWVGDVNDEVIKEIDKGLPDGFVLELAAGLNGKVLTPMRFIRKQYLTSN